MFVSDFWDSHSMFTRLKPEVALFGHTNDLQAIQLTRYLRRRNIIKGFGSIKNGRIFQFDDNEDKRNLHERKNDSSIKIVTDNSDAFYFNYLHYTRN